jgi:predicted O-methyltransferase YrrM
MLCMLAVMEDLIYIAPPRSIPQIQEQTVALKFGMASEPLTGALLRTLAASRPGGRLLELGTGTGLATAWLLDGMDQTSTLTSVDNDSLVQAVALQCLGDDLRLQLMNMNAIDFLRNQTPQSFDLVFADAIPGKYDGLDLALAVVRPGGFYVIDDMLPQTNWPAGHAEKAQVLTERLARQEDFTLVPMVWASGIIVAVRKP